MDVRGIIVRFPVVTRDLSVLVRTQPGHEAGLSPQSSTEIRMSGGISPLSLFVHAVYRANLCYEGNM